MGNSQISTYRTPGDDDYRLEKDRRASCQATTVSPKIDCHEIMRRLNRASASLPEISCNGCSRRPNAFCIPTPSSLGSPCRSTIPFLNNCVHPVSSYQPEPAWHNCSNNPANRRMHQSDYNMNLTHDRCCNCGQNPFQNRRGCNPNFPAISFTPEQMQNPCISALVDAMQTPGYPYNFPSSGFSGSSPPIGSEVGIDCNEAPGSDATGNSGPYNQPGKPGSIGNSPGASRNGNPATTNPVPTAGSGPMGPNSRNPGNTEACQEPNPTTNQPTGIPLTKAPYGSTNENSGDPNRKGTQEQFPGSSPNPWNLSGKNPGSGPTPTAVSGPFGTYSQNPSPDADACNDIVPRTIPTNNYPYRTGPTPYDANARGGQGQFAESSPNPWNLSGANPGSGPTPTATSGPYGTYSQRPSDNARNDIVTRTIPNSGPTNNPYQTESNPDDVNTRGGQGQFAGSSPNQSNLPGATPGSGLKPTGASGPYGTYSQNPSPDADIVPRTIPAAGSTNSNPYRTGPNPYDANRTGAQGQGQGPGNLPNSWTPSDINHGSRPTATSGPYDTSQSSNGPGKPTVGPNYNTPYGSTSGDPFNGPEVQGQYPGSPNQSKPYPKSNGPNENQNVPNNGLQSSNGPADPGHGFGLNQNSYPPDVGNSNNGAPNGSIPRAPAPRSTPERQGTYPFDPNGPQGNTTGTPVDQWTETSGPYSDLYQAPSIGNSNPPKSNTGGVSNNGPATNNDRSQPDVPKTFSGTAAGAGPGGRNGVDPSKPQNQPGMQNPNYRSPDGGPVGRTGKPEGEEWNRLNPDLYQTKRVPSTGQPNRGTAYPTSDTKPGKPHNFDPNTESKKPSDNGGIGNPNTSFGPDTGTQTDFNPGNEKAYFSNGDSEVPVLGSGSNPADRDKNRPIAILFPSDHNDGFPNGGTAPVGAGLKNAPSAEPYTGVVTGNGAGSDLENFDPNLKPGYENPIDGASVAPKNSSVRPNGSQGKVSPNSDGGSPNLDNVKGNIPKAQPGNAGLNDGTNFGPLENQPGFASGIGLPGNSGSYHGNPSGETKQGNKPIGQGSSTATNLKNPNSTPSAAKISSGNDSSNIGLKTPSKQKFKRKEGDPSRTNTSPDKDTIEISHGPDNSESKKPNGGKQNGRNPNGSVFIGNDDPSLGLEFRPDGQNIGVGRKGREEPGNPMIKKGVKPAASTQQMRSGPTEPNETSGTGQNESGSDTPITGRKKTGQTSKPGSTNQPVNNPENCDDNPGKGFTKQKKKNPDSGYVKTGNSCAPPPSRKTDKATHSGNGTTPDCGNGNQRPRSKGRPGSPLYYAPPFSCLTPEIYLPNHVTRLMKRCQSAGTNTINTNRPATSHKPREQKCSESDGYRHIRRLKSDGGGKLCTTNGKFSPFYFGPSYTLQPLKLKPSTIKIQPRTSCEVVSRTKSQTEAYLKCCVPGCRPGQDSQKGGGHRRPVSVPALANRQPNQCTPSNLKKPALSKCTPARAATSNPKATVNQGPENMKCFGNRSKDLRRTRSVSASKMNGGSLPKKASQSSCISNNGNQPEKSILKTIPSSNKRKLKKSISFGEEFSCKLPCPPAKGTKLKKKQVKKVSNKFAFHVNPLGLNDDDDLVDDEPCTYTIQGTPYTPAFTIPIPARNSEGFFLLKSEFDKFLERYACVIRAAQDAELSRLPYTPPVTGGGGPKGSGQCNPASCAASQQCPTSSPACAASLGTTPVCSTPCTPTSPIGQDHCAGTYGIYTLDQFGLPTFGTRLKKLESDDSLDATAKLQDIGLFTIAKPGSGTSRLAMSPMSERSETIIDTDNNDLDFIPNDDDLELDAIINQIIRDTSMESERNAEESPSTPTYNDDDLLCIDEVLDRPSMSNFFENSIESFLGQSVVSSSSRSATQDPPQITEAELPDPESTLSDKELELVTKRVQIVLEELPVEIVKDSEHNENSTVPIELKQVSEEESGTDANLEKASIHDPSDAPLVVDAIPSLKVDDEPRPLVSVLKKRSVVSNSGLELSPAASKSKEIRVTFSPDAPEVKIFDGEIPSPGSSDFSLGPPPPRPEGLGEQPQQPDEAARVSRSRSTMCIVGNSNTPTSEYYLSMFRNPRRYDTFKSSSDAGSPEAQLLTLNRPSSSDSNMGAAAEAHVIETPMNASLDSVLEARIKQSVAEHKIDKLVNKITTRQASPAEDQ